MFQCFFWSIFSVIGQKLSYVLIKLDILGFERCYEIIWFPSSLWSLWSSCHVMVVMLALPCQFRLDTADGWCCTRTRAARTRDPDLGSDIIIIAITRSVTKRSAAWCVWTSIRTTRTWIWQHPSAAKSALFRMENLIFSSRAHPKIRNKNS